MGLNFVKGHTDARTPELSVNAIENTKETSFHPSQVDSIDAARLVNVYSSNKSCGTQSDKLSGTSCLSCLNSMLVRAVSCAVTELSVHY